MKNSLLRADYYANVGKQSKNTQWKYRQSQTDTHVEVNIFARQKSKARLGFGLFRINFTLPKHKQKELAQNSTEILQIFETAQVILLSTAVRT